MILGIRPIRRCASTALNWPIRDLTSKTARGKYCDRLKDVESHWSSRLREAHDNGYNKRNGEKKYVLSMFPYPSGNLHMGHMRVYTISDVSARYYRLNGYNVIHPIGWDAFGLPAENAARDRGIDPALWTQSNVATMREQLLRTGVLFDWDREISTCDPSFYRWTQWIFLRLHEKGLLRRSLTEVHWDPVDGTVLAAEQIDADGRSWRSGAKAEKKKLRQWIVDTPKYAKRLSDGLKRLSGWQDVASIQQNWIGQCDAYRFQFPLKGTDGTLQEELLDARVLDAVAISHARFFVLAADHPLSDKSRQDEKEPYVLPLKALNAVTGEWMPLIVVPETYEGPHMFLGARPGDTVADRLLIEKFGLKSNKEMMAMNTNDVQEIAAFGGYGGYLTSRTLQEWVVSRQRRWGTPIPMILSENGMQAERVADNLLPVTPEQVASRKRVQSQSLSGGYGMLETDTLDTFFDSSWYYLRYLDPHNQERLVSDEAQKHMPVDLYVGGVEHAAVHMFFARFISHFLTDIGATKHAEPFVNLIPQGIVRGKTFVEPDSGRYVKNDQVQFVEGEAKNEAGQQLKVLFEKMSKSKHNGVDPLVVLEKDGVDLTRMQLLEAAAPRQPVNWADSDLRGQRKWLERVAWIVSTYVEQRENSPKKPIDSNFEKKMTENYNYFVRNVSMCLEVLHLHNTSLARLQGFTNTLRKLTPQEIGTSPTVERCVHALITMMQVFVPNSAAEFWGAISQASAIEHKRSGELAEQNWPQVDSDADVDFILMVNDVSAGREALPRKLIENIALEQVVERAWNVEHKEVLGKLKAKGYSMSKSALSSREGFHVTLSLEFPDVDATTIGKVLDQIQQEKYEALKAERRNKKKKKEENA